MKSLPFGVHTIYSPGSTALETNRTWEIHYNDGSSGSGIVFEDSVSVGGLVIENQAVEAAVLASGTVLTLECDGILGLSLQANTISPAGTPTFLENLGKLGPSIFTCSLTRPNEPPGFFTFGYIDPSIPGTPEYTSVDPEHGYWEFPSQFVIINGIQYSRPGNTAIADTGTTIILVSDDILPTIYSPMGGIFDSTQQGWIYPSTIEIDNLPNISFPVGNTVVTLDKSDLGFTSNGSWIFGAIQSRGNDEYDSFGDYWLRNVYAIWDFGVTGDGIKFGVVPRTPS